MKQFALATVIFLILMFVGLEFAFNWSTNQPPVAETPPPSQAVEDVIDALKTAVPVPVEFEPMTSTPVPTEPVQAATSTPDPNCVGYTSSTDDYWVDKCGNKHPWLPAADTYEDYLTRAAEKGVTPQPRSENKSSNTTNGVKSGKELLEEAARTGRNGTQTDDVPYAMLFGRKEKKDSKCEGDYQQFLSFSYGGKVIPAGWFDKCGEVHEGVMPDDVKEEKGK